MATRDRRPGCGCCGCLLALIVFLGILTLVAAGFFYFNASSNLARFAAPAPAASPAIAINRQTYAPAREKLNRFFADAAERSLTLSNAEVISLLNESREFRILIHG